MARVENASEGMGRWILACAIAGTIPLALWGGACGKRPVVEPKLDGGGDDGRRIDGASDLNGDVSPTDRPYAVDLVGADAVGDAPATTFDGPVVPDSASDGTARDLPPDFPSVPDAGAGCCAPGIPPVCAADGRSLYYCVNAAGGLCVLPDAGSTYGYVWRAYECPLGCGLGGAGTGGTNGTANCR